MNTLAPGPLKRRLFLAYLCAFAVVIAVFALSVRFAFVATIERQADARLETLARAGLAVVHFGSGRFSVDRGIVRALRTDREGLQWFDVSGRSIESQGLVPARPAPITKSVDQIEAREDTMLTRTVEVHDPDGRVRGYVRASESDESLSAATRALDLGLAIGSFLAIGTATAGGWYLARQAVASTEDAFQRLRQFTADASHELRGPIGAIANNAQLAREEGAALPATARARLENIAAIANDMRQLVDDLLILARATQPLTRELFLVDVDAVLEHVRVRCASEAAAKNLTLRISSTHPPALYGNPGQVERTVLNLVENAIRYTDRGSVDISCTSDSTSVRIVVTDTGIGIAPEHVPFVFDRFWRADSMRSGRGGTGLGLSIALALARRHGGTLTVSTQRGSGSAFCLTLPRRPTAAVRA